MGGHDIARASMVAREITLERERQMLVRHQHAMLKAERSGQISELSWFGGIKASAHFLADAAREALAQRRMTEAHS